MCSEVESLRDVIRQTCSYVESLQDIIQQLCSLSQEFAGCHPTTIGVDDYQNFGSNLYVYRGTSFFASYLVRMLLYANEFNLPLVDSGRPLYVLRVSSMKHAIYNEKSIKQFHLICTL